MTNSEVCIVCLATDMKMHSILNTSYQGDFEKLANLKLNVEDTAHDKLCYICYSQLQRCCRFMSMTRNAAKTLNQQSRNGMQVGCMLLSQDTVSVLKVHPRYNFVTSIITSYDKIFVEETIDNNPTVLPESCVVEIEPISIKKELVDEDQKTEAFFVFVKEEPTGNNYEDIDSEQQPVKNEYFQVKEVGECVTKEMKASEPTCNNATKADNILKTTEDLPKQIKSKRVRKTEKSPIKHPCNSCDRKFSRKGYLKRHLRVHTGEKPYICNDCNKDFSQKSHLIQHLRLHTGEKPFTCHVCNNKSFNHKYNYKEHMKKHFGVKSHKCDSCSALFHQRADLRRHMLCHTGERPFSCDLCDAKFTQKGHLRKHEKLLHTDKKVYECHMCPQKFGKRIDLLGHKMVHKGQSFTCTHAGCTKSFYWESMLISHMRAHTGERPYSCSKCKKSYKHKGHFNKHICVLQEEEDMFQENC